MINFTIHNLPGEEEFTFRESRWKYVSLHYKNGEKEHRYFHSSCDVITGKSGFCLACGASSPVVPL